MPRAGQCLFEFAHAAAGLPGHADFARRPAERPHVFGCRFRRRQILVVAARGWPALLPSPARLALLAGFLGTGNRCIGDAIFPGPVVGVAIENWRSWFGGALAAGSEVAFRFSPPAGFA